MRLIVLEMFGYDGAVAIAVRVTASAAVGVLIGYLVVGSLSTVGVRRGT